MPRLVQPLPDGPLDIIGDVHGELGALRALLDRLGVDVDAGTATRPVVFVGDLVDRGPDSPGVVAVVRRLVEAGVAHCIIGNHELNLLLGLRKEGNGWAWGDADDGHPRVVDGALRVLRFGSQMASPAERDAILDFFRTLPLALARPDLRVVHACWSDGAVADLPESADLVSFHRGRSRAIRKALKARGLIQAEAAERAAFADLLRLDVRPTRPLPAHTEAEEARQEGHPSKVLTSGPERAVPFEKLVYAGGKWRFVQRHPWWETYDAAPAVVVGHYWRRRQRRAAGSSKDTWETRGPFDWTGPRGNVFCVDYSVGRRFVERDPDRVGGFRGALAALRWPERTLVFDDRADPIPTVGFGRP